MIVILAGFGCIFLLLAGTGMFMWHVWQWDQGGFMFHIPAAAAWVIFPLLAAVKIAYSYSWI